MLQFIKKAVRKFIKLDDTFASYAGKAGQYLRVKSTEDGLETVTIVISTKELDYMEYTTDVLAQAAYVTDAVSASIISQTVNENNGALGRAGATVEYRSRQSFTLAAPATISGLKVTFRASIGTPAGQVTARIETDNAGQASGTLVHANATAAFTPTASAENTIPYTSFLLAAGYYWIVLNCDDQATDTRWQVGRTEASEYSGGSYAYTEAGVWNDTTWDLTFKVDVPSLQCFSEATIKTQGDYSLKGFAAMTVSLNKTLTRTVSPTIDLSGMTKIEFYIYASRTGANIKIGIHDSGGATSEKTYTVVIANTWEKVTWDISGVADGDKDAIDKIIVTILDATAENTFYLDWLLASRVV